METTGIGKWDNYRRRVVFLLFFVLGLVALDSFSRALQWVNTTTPGFLVGASCNVYPITTPSWERNRPGVTVRDRVLAVNGIRVLNHRQFNSIIKAKKPGERVVFQVERDGKPVSVPGKLILFSYQDFFYAFLIPFMVGLTYLLIGSVVYFMRSTRKIAAVFSLFCSAMAVMLVGLFDSFSDITYDYLFDIAYHAIPPLFIHMALVFPGEHPLKQRFPSLLRAVYALSAVIGVVKAAAAGHSYTVWVQADMAADLYALAGFAVFLGMMLHRAVRSDDGLLRKRAQVVLLGMASAFVFFAVTLGVSAAGQWSMINLPLVFTVFFPLYMGYAVLKHNLFDVRRVFLSSLFFFVFSLILIWVLLQFSVFSGLILVGTQDPGQYIGLFILIVVMVLSFSWLRERFQHAIDLTFYRGEADLRGLLQEISRTLHRIDPGMQQEGGGRRLNLVRPLEQFFRKLAVDRVAVLFTGDGGLVVDERLSFNLSEARRYEFSRELEALLNNPQRIVFRQDLTDGKFPAVSASELQALFKGTGTMLLFPLLFDERVQGVLLVGEKCNHRHFDDTEVEMLRTLSGYLAISRVNTDLLEQVKEQGRFEQELKIATDIQNSMLPRELAAVPGYRIAYHYKPAREVGGDLYDFIEQNSDRLVLVAGDVSGKGMPAALFSAVTLGVIKSVWRTHLSVKDFLQQVNDYLRQVRFGRLNIAMLCAKFDINEQVLELVNAGMPYPILFKQRVGRAKYLDLSGQPLASMDRLLISERRIPFTSGDIFVFYTDGLVEVANPDGELFGFDRLLELIEKHRFSDSETLLNFVLKYLHDWAGGTATQLDDQTMLVVEIR